jgi:hypothetical protein
LIALKQDLRVRLIPKHPPGRVNRKARAFEPEIVRLRSEGYTCEAIRAALTDIGVDVSLSTVQREATRHSKRQPLIVTKQASLLSAAAAIPAPPSSSTRAISNLSSDPRTGKEIAADFVGKRFTNPLLRDRNNHESRGH